MNIKFKKILRKKTSSMMDDVLIVLIVLIVFGRFLVNVINGL